MKKYVTIVFKMIVSAVLSLLILSGFCLIYDNQPLVVEQPDGITNYRLSPNKFWSSLIEGAGFGRTDNIGYNNAHDIDYNEPTIAFLGSSQTEAFQVLPQNNFVSKIEEKLMNDAIPENDIQCVNLGISSHYFNVSASNFEELPKRFENIKCVVIEAGKLNFTASELEKALKGGYSEKYEDKGIIYNAIRRIPYIRTLKRQIEKAFEAEDSETVTVAAYKEDDSVYRDKLGSVLAKIANIAEKNSFDVLIMHHSQIGIDNQQKIYRDEDPEIAEIFRECCEEQGICFLDVTGKFIEHYKATFQMPYGFMNTTLGPGHLNEVGHRIIAEAVYEKILEMEVTE